MPPIVVRAAILKGQVLCRREKATNRNAADAHSAVQCVHVLQSLWVTTSSCSRIAEICPTTTQLQKKLSYKGTLSEVEEFASQ
jgi:hypothetical protein